MPRSDTQTGRMGVRAYRLMWGSALGGEYRVCSTGYLLNRILHLLCDFWGPPIGQRPGQAL